MSAAPLVSVIIPCYNYGRFLADALDSVRAQSYSTWECIIVDDGSTDNTREVGLLYTRKDTRFKYLHQQNSGVSGARNTALQEAAGRYIQLLDADDLLEAKKLELQVALMEENPDIDLVYSSMIFFKEEDKENKTEPQLLQHKASVSGRGETLLKSLLDDNLFLPGCVLFRKSLFHEVGYFKKGIEGIEDWDYCYRAALLKKAFYHDEREGTRLLVRSHTNNASNNGFKMLKSKIAARNALLYETAKLLEQKGAGFSKKFIRQACKVHNALLNRDAARLQLFYGNAWQGCLHTLKYAYYSKKIYPAFYEAAYWLKERLKRRVKSVQQKGSFEFK